MADYDATDYCECGHAWDDHDLRGDVACNVCECGRMNTHTRLETLRQTVLRAEHALHFDHDDREVRAYRDAERAYVLAVCEYVGPDAVHNARMGRYDFDDTDLAMSAAEYLASYRAAWMAD